jgi:hypothetical protein
MPRTLTAPAAICRGEEESPRAILRLIGDDIRGSRLDTRAANPRLEFLRSRRIHFARLAFSPSDRGPDRKRLLYSANYDGQLNSHLAELTAITSDMAAIWAAAKLREHRGVRSLHPRPRARARHVLHCLPRRNRREHPRRNRPPAGFADVS